MGWEFEGQCGDGVEVVGSLGSVGLFVGVELRDIGMDMDIGLVEREVADMGSREGVVGTVGGWVLCGAAWRRAVNFVVCSTVVARLGLCSGRRLVWRMVEGGGGGAWRNLQPKFFQ